jgi:hypothetical protein
VRSTAFAINLALRYDPILRRLPITLYIDVLLFVVVVATYIISTYIHTVYYTHVDYRLITRPKDELPQR